jgi:hypothetical protein
MFTFSHGISSIPMHMFLKSLSGIRKRVYGDKREQNRPEILAMALLKYINTD